MRLTVRFHCHEVIRDAGGVSGRSTGEECLCLWFVNGGRIWAIPAETAGNGKDNVLKKSFSNVQ